MKPLLLVLMAHARDPTGPYSISTEGGLGPQFDGIGAISGGGATSKLLISYPEPFRSEVLDFLFKPQFGASLHILKVEIGGDGQATEGTEASHMHTPMDESYDRGYEWWLMKEAKKRNPDIKLYGLAWTFPYHIEVFNQSMITYLQKWVQGAKEVHDLEIDFIGVWNEHGSSSDFVKNFRRALDDGNFSSTKIIGTDWNCHGLSSDPIIKEVRKDKDLRDAVHAFGYHYPHTNAAQQCGELFQDLPVTQWASEESSSADNSQGGACWARSNNQNWVNGNLTASIMWNLVTSFYTTLTYFGAKPWSGHYEVMSPVWATAHTTQFTKPGWRFVAKGVGNHTSPGSSSGWLRHGGSYAGYVDPAAASSDWSLVIEKLTATTSDCLRGNAPAGDVLAENATIVIGAALAKKVLAVGGKMSCWRSQWPASDPTQVQQLFRPCEDVVLQTRSSSSSSSSSSNSPAGEGIVDLTYYITVAVGVDTVTTLSTTARTQRHGDFSQPPAPMPFPSRYVTDFSDSPLNSESPYFSDQSGKFEIRASSEVSATVSATVSASVNATVNAPPCSPSTAGRVMRQVSPVVGTVYRGDTRPLSVLGDPGWRNTTMSFHFLLGERNATGVFAGVRVRNLNWDKIIPPGKLPINSMAETTNMAGLFVGVGMEGWTVATTVGGLGMTRQGAGTANYVAQGSLASPLVLGQWNALQMTVSETGGLDVGLQGKSLFHLDVGAKAVPGKGQVAVGLLDYGDASIACFSVDGS